ncbi:MAG: hypothetical protein JNM39_07745 [Bdellovibrionaceae bacterium]|nr:hypothetical protein [Pseudobdellovibrionaceae bacterium]
MGKFESKVDREGVDVLVSLGGVIDEDVDFSQLNVAGAEKVSVDFSGVKSINSCGIREWMKWIASLKTAEVTYVKCPKVIIDQINMVDGFLPSNGKVESFYVPYYNETTGIEKIVLFRYGVDFKEKAVTPPAQVLDDQGQPMEMDVLEAKYFRFINK